MTYDCQTQPVLNTSPEVLVEMLRILETAGLKLIEHHPEPAHVRKRVQALCDRLFIEIMRSYRRRQNTSQRTLSEILQSQYNISQMLIQCPPQQVRLDQGNTDVFRLLGFGLQPGATSHPR